MTWRLKAQSLHWLRCRPCSHFLFTIDAYFLFTDAYSLFLYFWLALFLPPPPSLYFLSFNVLKGLAHAQSSLLVRR